MTNIFTITHNEDKTLALVFRYAGTLSPVPLDTITEIVVKLPLLASGYMLKKLSLAQVQIDPVSPKLGRVLIPLAAADSLLLNVGIAQDIEADLMGPAGTTPVRFPKSLTVCKMIDEA